MTMAFNPFTPGQQGLPMTGGPVAVPQHSYQPPQPTAQPVQAAPPQAPQSQPMVVAPVGDLIEAARRQAEAAAQQQIQQVQAQAQSAEQRVADFERRERERQLAAMPQEQQQLERIRAAEQMAHQAIERANAIAYQAQNQARMATLQAYRERVIRREGAETLPELIGGNSEQEIELSAQVAKQEYSRLRSHFQQQFQSDMQQQMASLVPAPPMNPSWVPPVHPQLAAQPLPTATNPIVVPQEQGIDTREMTSEEAVRSGRYAEIRGRLLGGVKGQQAYGGPMGTLPRHMTSAPNHVAQPGGVMQPQGFPTGPVQNPHLAYAPAQQQGFGGQVQAPPAMMGMHPQPYPVQYAVPQAYQAPYAQPGYPMYPQAPAAYGFQAPNPMMGYPQGQQFAPMVAPGMPGQDAHMLGGKAKTVISTNAAAEAVARTHAGQNPLLGANPGAAEALRTATNMAGGASPQALFRERFLPTPPIVGAAG